MAYISPFERIIKQSKAPFETHAYTLECSKPLYFIIDDLKVDLNNIENASFFKPLSIANNPPRIVRAAIDFKIENAEDNQRDSIYLEIVKKAISAALACYRFEGDALNRVEEFEDMVRQDAPSLLERSIGQKPDSVTWRASHPIKSEYSANYILSQTYWKDVLFIAIAHGGVAAGMDVFNMYCDKARSHNSAFYATRLSIDKMGDSLPRVNKAEIDYLKDLARKREIVVFDEDISTGNTITSARQYFEDLFGKKIVTRANDSVKAI